MTELITFCEGVADDDDDDDDVGGGGAAEARDHPRS